MVSAWLPHPPTGDGLVLLCFPWGGAGAGVFSSWRDHPSVQVCPVQLPGRERRIAEPLPTGAASLVEAATRALAPHCRQPFALFGHSVGALLAFAVGAALSARGMRPVRLIVSGSRAPHGAPEDLAIHRLDDEQLLRAVVGLGGMPGELVERPEVRAVILPALRADLRFAETYVVAEPRVLDCHVTAIAADADPSVDVDSMAAWRDTTSGPFELVTIAGGHFAAVESDAGMPAVVAEAVGQGRSERAPSR